MFSQASVILPTVGLMATGSMLILVIARSVRIILECFLVKMVFQKFRDVWGVMEECRVGRFFYRLYHNSICGYQEQLEKSRERTLKNLGKKTKRRPEKLKLTMVIFNGHDLRTKELSLREARHA